jgi:hypothetical protein
MSGDDRQYPEKRKEIEKNFSFFLSQLPNITQTQRGRYALLRHEEIVGFFDTALDALQAGKTAYPDGIFSIQQVTDTPINLGYYSYAVPLVAAR